MPHTQSLYKYRSLATRTDMARTRAIFTTGKTYFAGPRSFNDPFDCKFTLSFNARKRAKKATYLEFLTWNGVKERKAKREAAQMVQPDHRKALARWEGDRFQHVLDATERIGVFCLTESKDDILMWSHYADRHRGVCLEFRMSRPEHMDWFAQAGPVQYRDAFPVMNFYTTPEGQKIRRCLLTKSTRWSYERERRMIELNGPGERPVPPGVLKGVILGAQMSDGDRDEVLSWVDAHPTRIVVYEARLKKAEYGLDIARLPRRRQRG